MGISYNSSIVTNQLVLCLDAGNPRSYPGTGTAWYDISGNNNHFTLVNGPVYNSANQGSISFDGVNDYASSNNNINLTGYDYIVVEVWFAGNTTSYAMLIEHTANWNSNLGGWGLAINTNGTVVDIVGTMHTNHNSEGARNYAFSIGTNWNCQTNIFSRISDSTGRLTYCNGNLVPFEGGSGYSTNTVSTAGGSFANAILYLGSRGGADSFFNGRISNVKIYGFKMTATQVSQNFNALRGRYGI